MGRRRGASPVMSENVAEEVVKKVRSVEETVGNTTGGMI
jgi:hypothetical protein